MASEMVDQGTKELSTHETEVVPVEGRDPVYFGYYSLFTHQQNMLLDSVRTSIYQNAICNNSELFKGKLVLDCGAGSGILSYFAVSAGAEKVYSVEASGMARKMKKLLKRAEGTVTGKSVRNSWLNGKIEVVQAKIEEPNLPIPKVDILISEPIGVLLVHERMIESFLCARDRYLKPGGVVLPASGQIHLLPFSDAMLWSETIAKARFWENDSFYGVDLTPLAKDAREEYFGMPVVGHFDPRTVSGVENGGGYTIDFTTIKQSDLLDFTIPISWTMTYTGLVHGIAGWFDLSFLPSNFGANVQQYYLSTSPSSPNTHWQQIRFLFLEPLAANAGDNVRGWMRLKVNPMRSYTIVAEVVSFGSNSEEPVIAQGLSDPLHADVTKLLEMKVETDDETLEWKLDERSSPTGFSKRRGRWQLQEQTYSYTYNPSLPSTDFKPEYSCLYSSEEQYVQNIEMNVDQSVIIDEMMQT